MKNVVVNNFLLISVIILSWIGGIAGHQYIHSLISHNVIINSLILFIFIACTIWIFIDRAILLTVVNQVKSLAHQDVISKNDIYLRKIFGKNFSSIIYEDGKYDLNIYMNWKKSIESKSQILEYVSGTLIGLGLLGTFIGLMKTLANVFNVISQDVQGKELISSLSEPLSGMSVAFSASLLGLGTSLITGFIAILVSKINSEYLKEIENWLYTKSKKEEPEVTNYTYLGKNISLFKEVILLVSEINGIAKEIKYNSNDILQKNMSNDKLMQDIYKALINIDSTLSINHNEHKEAINELILKQNEMNENLYSIKENTDSLIDIRLEAQSIERDCKLIIDDIKHKEKTLHEIKDNTNHFKFIESMIFKSDIVKNMIIQNNQRMENIHSSVNTLIEKSVSENYQLKQDYKSVSNKLNEINNSINLKNKDIELISSNIKNIKNASELSLNESVATRAVIEGIINKEKF
ncbi:hypothetical protein INA60_004753 [Salmonella enterica]|nr:hypothetical protein [Salmonella enterica]EGJ5834990.1 hypothetical protein [Salmonella enterica]